MNETFDYIHDEHVFCWTAIKCQKCKTIVRYSYDSSNYDDEFECPVCTGYSTWFKYWKIDDPEYDNVLTAFMEMERIEVEMYARMDRRKGKRDGVLAEFRDVLKRRDKEKYHRYWDFTIEIDNITNRWPLRGLRIMFVCWEKEEGGLATWRKHIRIPLSWSAFYIQFIYPKTKKGKRFWETIPSEEYE